MRQWNQFKLLGDGDFLRNYAREHNLFIYPYDLLTGSDIALFEDLDARRNDERYLICALSEVAPGSDKGGKLYKLAPQAIYKHATACRGATYEAALAFWNERMQKLGRQSLIIGLTAGKSRQSWQRRSKR